MTSPQNPQAKQLVSSYRRAWKRLYPGEAVPTVAFRYFEGHWTLSVSSKDGVGDFMSFANFRRRISDMLIWADERTAA